MSKTYKMGSHKKEDMMMSIEGQKPSFTVGADKFPPLKGWKVGEKYTIQIEVEQVSQSKDRYSDKPMMSAEFVINKMTDMSESEHEKKGKKGYH